MVLYCHVILILYCPMLLLPVFTVISILCCSYLTTSHYFLLLYSLLDCIHYSSTLTLLFILQATLYIALYYNHVQTAPQLLHFCLDLQPHSVSAFALCNDNKVESESDVISQYHSNNIELSPSPDERVVNTPLWFYKVPVCINPDHKDKPPESHPGHIVVASSVCSGSNPCYSPFGYRRFSMTVSRLLKILTSA